MQQLHVERRGSGIPVLVLHGFLSDHRQMLPIVEALAECECFLPDLLGCGKSTKIPSTSIIQENAQLLRDLCKKHNIKIVIAYSIGGLIALELHLPHTVFISSFCNNPLLFGALKSLHGKEDTIRHLLISNRAHAQRLLSSTLHRNIAVPGVNEASVECALDYLTAAQQDYSARAAKLSHVLVIHGTKDWLIDYQNGIYLAQEAHAPLVFVPEEHFQVLKNETVHGAVNAFVREVREQL